ncbi:MAG: hypothetical protein M1308_13725 [Actinobacteria bacterium]|nr:hypothetical protein [Actinomycetota bacterium]
MDKPSVSFIIEKIISEVGDQYECDNFKEIMEHASHKPSSCLLKSYDLGSGNQYNQDFVWHLLKKEKSFDLREKGKIGAINFNSDISLFFGFSNGNEEPAFNFKSNTLVHLIDLWVEEFELFSWLKGIITFIPVDSMTLLAIVEVKNSGESKQDLTIYQTMGKGDARQDENINGVHHPQQMTGDPSRYIGVHTTTKDLVWSEYDKNNKSILACYDEISPVNNDKLLGYLLCALGSSSSSSKQFFCESIDSIGQSEKSNTIRYIGQSFKTFLEPGESKVELFCLGFRKFSSVQHETMFNVPTFHVEDKVSAIDKEIEHLKKVMNIDYTARIKESVLVYKKYPLFDLPNKTWIADSYAALELPRANSYSSYKKMRYPFYNFCRAQGTDLEDWWSEGTACSVERTVFGTVITNPNLAIMHLKNIFDYQAQDGRIPFCVNQNGEYKLNLPPSFGVKNETISPEICWQSWHAYLWSGDKKFLREAYEAGKRNLDWWMKNRDRTGEGLCYWLGVIEGVRDTSEPWIPTWREVPVDWQEALDLNCYLAMEEEHLTKMAMELGDYDQARIYEEKYKLRIQLMNKYMWDEDDKCYYGISEGDGKKVRVRDISTLMPLWCGAVPLERAKYLIDYYEDPDEFKTDYGVPTLSKSSVEFDPGFHWFGPMWTWFNWLVILGLKRYGYYNKAAQLAYKTINMEFESLEKTAHFREYYHSIKGFGIGLCDYIWSTLAGAMVVQVLLGIEPTEMGVQVMPSLPEQWSNASIRNLHIRNHVISVSVMKCRENQKAGCLINGKPFSSSERGVMIPWGSMPENAKIEIIQEFANQDMPSAPEWTSFIKDREAPIHSWVWLGRSYYPNSGNDIK